MASPSSRSSYSPVGEDARAPVLVGPLRLALSATLAAVLVGAAIVEVLVTRPGAAAGPQQPAHLRRDGGAAVVQLAESSTWVQGGRFPSHAPAMDVDTEYQVDGGWGTNFDHIPTPEMCAAMCWGVPKCKAYTWVKNAGLDGCPSQCWLKSAVGNKAHKVGLVSGVPPPRHELAEVPSGAGGAAGSLYCFALMVPGGYEEGLLRWQHDNKASIFSCDKGAVYSNKPVKVAEGVVAHVVNSTLKCGYGGDSMSALNSWIFIAVWEKVIHVGEYKDHAWVVKVDPDAVFFPDRLGRHLVQHRGAAYINNCKYGMHGPIEVFSSGAINALAKDYAKSWDGRAPSTCVTKMHFGQWGEDMFIDQCLHTQLKLGPRPTEPKLMCESHCDCEDWYWCSEGPDMVSYHPFKSIDSYKTCMAAALGGGLPAKRDFVLAVKK
uniref:Apple domain-containing protein n=1 Tax=Zooxanthella nutricula TaxID=1333877 RepID=A0A7S2M2N6_9DINO